MSSEIQLHRIIWYFVYFIALRPIWGNKKKTQKKTSEKTEKRQSRAKTRRLDPLEVEVETYHKNFRVPVCIGIRIKKKKKKQSRSASTTVRCCISWRWCRRSHPRLTTAGRNAHLQVWTADANHRRCNCINKCIDSYPDPDSDFFFMFCCIVGSIRIVCCLVMLPLAIWKC